jgi:hypothetical protein
VADLPRGEQLGRLRLFLSQPDCERVSEATTDDIRAKGQALAARLRDEKPVRSLRRSEVRLIGGRKMRVLVGEVVVLIIVLHILGADAFIP